MTRLYHVPDAPIPRGFSSISPLAEGESSDEECIRCQRDKLNCDGDNPCYTYVKVQGRRVATCNYQRSNRIYESWAVRPFQLNNTGEKIIRENYERYTGRGKLNISQELKHTRDTEAQNKTRDDSKTENGTNILQDGGNPKRFKFGLSAYSRQPAVQLKPNITSCSKYYDAKVEELKSHEDKGTWKIVPLKQGIKPVTSR